MANICNYRGFVIGKNNEVNNFKNFMYVEDKINFRLPFEILEEESKKDITKINFKSFCRWSLEYYFKDTEVKDGLKLEDFLKDNPSLTIRIQSIDDEQELTEILLAEDGEIKELERYTYIDSTAWDVGYEIERFLGTDLRRIYPDGEDSEYVTLTNAPYAENNIKEDFLKKYDISIEEYLKQKRI